MSTELRRRLFLAAALASSQAAFAQILSSPLGSGPKGKQTEAAGVALGTGAGVHSPLSPFQPLPQRADVVPWSLLTAMRTHVDKGRILPKFSSEQMALHRKLQRVQGFMMPLAPGEKQNHFLLASVPLTCGFCLPGGPESIIEVRTKIPVKYTMEPVVVSGNLALLNEDPAGLYYRMTDAVAVK